MTAEEGEERMVDHSDDAPKVMEFYGRVAEIESVLSLLDDSGVLVVRGLPGIGKTILASVICSQIRDRRNVLWHQTRKWDNPSSILLGIGRFLRANGKYRTYEHVSSGRSVDLSRVETLLERELDESNSVMFFDDFQNADSSVLDIFSMLVDVVGKVDGTNIIVLSREAVPFYDRRDVKIHKTVEEMELKGLDFESAKKWMQNKGVVDDYEEIYKRTGGHPLFLELATSYMEKIA
jgi:predicted ATPase